ncbi:hypothetical protein [Floridanema evergladense]|uniref:Uncharacterized protein n=1 Tax=Floridaenema evergladense BLCC-F167 TaxID=3153639 RepID=A0ABV4WRH7_9CYAN
MYNSFDEQIRQRIKEMDEMDKNIKSVPEQVRDSLHEAIELLKLQVQNIEKNLGGNLT